MEKKELQKIVIERILLEQSRTELLEQLPSLEKEARKYANLLELAEEGKDKLENSKLNMLVLGVFGKKEERLKQEENNLRKARGEANAAQFELDSAKNRIQSIAVELSGTEDLLEDFLSSLEGEEGNAVRWRIIALKEISNMRYAIGEDIIQRIRLYVRTQL